MSYYNNYNNQYGSCCNTHQKCDTYQRNDSYQKSKQNCQTFKHTIKDCDRDINLNINVCNPTPTPCGCQGQVTLTTGPFTVPIFADVAGLGRNDRLVVTLKNPTNCPLSATIIVSGCLAQTGTVTLCQPGTPTVETAVCTATVNVPANNCVQLPVDITAYQAGTLRVTTTGAYNLCEEGCDPTCGGLEISVAGGVGAATGGVPNAGLNFANPALTFPFEDFVVCTC